MQIARGLAFSLLFTVVAVLVLGYTRALANEGLFAGYEPFVIAGVGILSGVVFFLAVRRTGLSKGKLVVGLATAVLALPLLVLFGPFAFCVFFMSNTSCL
jgi:hypothetical protein